MQPLKEKMEEVNLASSLFALQLFSLYKNNGILLFAYVKFKKGNIAFLEDIIFTFQTNFSLFTRT